MGEFIELTVITKKLKDEAQKKFLEKLSSIDEDKTDEMGRDAEFFKNLGLSPPKELQEDESVDEEYDFTEDDYECTEASGMFRPESIMFVVDNIKEGSTVYINTDFSVTVREKTKEVLDKIKKIKIKNN
jgi:hypothetical protein